MKRSNNFAAKTLTTTKTDKETLENLNGDELKLENITATEESHLNFLLEKFYSTHRDFIEKSPTIKEIKETWSCLLNSRVLR